jgi:hypothetical protein
MGTDTTTDGTAALAGDVPDTARRPPAPATVAATALAAGAATAPVAADARSAGTAR